MYSTKNTFNESKSNIFALYKVFKAYLYISTYIVLKSIELKVKIMVIFDVDLYVCLAEVKVTRIIQNVIYPEKGC